MPARLYRLLELLLTNSGSFCDLLQVSKAVFFFHRHCRINIGVFKSRALHLCTDNLLLYVGGCLLQFCRRGDLLQAIQHHRTCHCLLCGELLLCFLGKEAPRMAHTAERPAAERGGHTKTKSSRDSFDTCDKCIRGNIADTVRLIRRTAVRRIDNAVMDEIIGDRLCALFGGFRRRNLQRILDLRLCERRDRLTLCHVVLCRIDNALDCIHGVFVRAALREKIDRAAGKRLCRNPEIRHFNSCVCRAAECRVKPPVIVREERIPVRVLHVPVFGETRARLRATHPLKCADTHPCTKPSTSELSHCRACNHRACGANNETASRTCCATDKCTAERFYPSSQCRPRKSRRLRRDESVAHAFTDALQHLRPRRCHPADNRRERIVKKGRRSFLVLRNHPFQIGGTFTVVIVRPVRHNLILQVVVFELFVPERDEVIERLHNPVRLPYGIHIVKSECRIVWIRQRHIAQFGKFLPDSLHCLIFGHDGRLRPLVIVDVQCLLIGNVVIDERIRRNSRRILYLFRLFEFILRRHEIV